MKDAAVLRANSGPLAAPCPCCGRIESDLEDLTPYGVFRDRNDLPVLILFNCPCRTSRSIRWEDAPYSLRKWAERWFRPRA